MLFCSLLYYFFQSVFYATLFCITPETFPSEVRNTAIGVINNSSNFASIVSPLIAGVILDDTSGNFVFVFAFGVAMAMAAVCTVWIVETKDYGPASLGELNYN